MARSRSISLGSSGMRSSSTSAAGVGAGGRPSPLDPPPNPCKIPPALATPGRSPMEATVWKDLFHLGLPVVEKILRPVIVYTFLVGSLRLAGKRELAQLNPFDLVVLLTLSNTVQNAIIGDDNSVTGGLLAAATLLAVNYLVVRFLYGHAALEQLVEGAS